MKTGGDFTREGVDHWWEPVVLCTPEPETSPDPRCDTPEVKG